MQKVIQQVVVDGYQSGVTDFETALAAAPADVQNDFNFVIAAVTNALGRADVGCVLSIAGHSDRVDTAGVDRHAARIQELESSEARAESCLEFMVSLINSEVAGLPADLDSLDTFSLAVRWAGASLLRESDAVLSDAQRERNRRVQIRAVAFVP